MTPKQCHGCGRTLYLGSPHYDVHIRITSGFDGYLSELDETNEEREEKLRALSQSLEEMSAEEAQDQVYQEIALSLCPDCRKRFVTELSEYAGDQDPPKAKKEPILLQ